MTETSSADLHRAAWDELNAQEDFIRGKRHLSDDELLAQLVDTLSKEKALVDRDAAWAPYLDDLERVRNWHGDDNAPPMPGLMTRADVEDLARYTSCPVCAPSLDHADKRPSARGWTMLKTGSLNYRHFGTAFSLADGTGIGVLTRIAKDETADGLEFAAYFDGVVEPVTDPLIEVMYRTGTRPAQA